MILCTLLTSIEYQSHGPLSLARMNPPRISVFGLGKLGASMAAAIASRGLDVVGHDIDPAAVAALNEGCAPVSETGLSEHIAAHRRRIIATASVDRAIELTDITFVIVPTPSDARGAFSLRYVSTAFQSIGRALREKGRYHLVVLTSTVLPGSTREALLPILERESGKQCGPDFGLCYSPEFVALGSVIKDYLHPDFHLIGQSDDRAGLMLQRFCEHIAPAPVQRLTLENAELAKVAINSFVTMKISFANMLSEICEQLPGGDIDSVSAALGLDRRIGRAYLTGGLGFGGPCFPRDNIALSWLGKHLGTDTSLLSENDCYNRLHPHRLLLRLRKHLPVRGGAVTVLGLAYKPGTNVIEASPGVQLASLLAAEGFQVTAYDPLAGGAAKIVLHGKVTIANSLREAMQASRHVIVCTPDAAFKGLSPLMLGLSPATLITMIDPWRCLSADLTLHPYVKHVPLGRCIESPRARQRLVQLWGDADTPRSTVQRDASTSTADPRRTGAAATLAIHTP
jgi:UDPglucose 6-dehydrogenase